MVLSVMPGSFHAEHIVVNRLTAMDMADLHAGAALGLHQFGGMFGIFLADFRTGDHGDELAVLFLHGTCQAVGHLGNVAASGNDLTVFQRHDLTLTDGAAVKLAVAGGIGDQAGSNLFGGGHHVDGILLRGGFGVKVQHSGHALGHGTGRQNQDLAVSQLFCLFGSHDDVLFCVP